MKILPSLAVIFALLCCSAAQAVRLEQPYIVEVPVASQSAADRVAGEKAGLLLVLEKLSGQRLDAQPAVSAAMNKAEGFVTQFSYVPAQQENGMVPAWLLHLVFSQPAVDRLLRDAGIALWSINRPQVLMMILDEKNHWLPAAGDEQQAAALKQQGQARGVPLVLFDNRAADVTVTAAAQNADTASLMPQITTAKADALLLGNIQGSDEKHWSGQWVLRIGEQEQRFGEKAASFSLLVDAALRRAAEIMSSGYRSSATSDMTPASLRLQIDGVGSYAAFMKLRQYLEQLDAVKHINDMQINGATVVVDVDVKGKDNFRNLFALLKSVQWQEEVAPQPNDAPDAKPVWRYRWVE